MPEEPMSEDEKWQRMMKSCREAIKIINAQNKRDDPYYEFREPEYLNWIVGADYHKTLWNKVYQDPRR